MTFLFGCNNVSLEFPTKQVLQNVSLGVNTGDRIGIVGKNGSGKSSLLKLLSKEALPDAGEVLSNGSLRVGTLLQSVSCSEEETVAHFVFGNTSEFQWASEAQKRRVVEDFLGGINLDAPMQTLSGGQLRRTDIARLLLGDWDALLLDEPTNHLDVLSIANLAQHLKSYFKQGTGAVLVVTHDRWFLDEVANSMWEVHDGRVEAFEGGFSAYIMQRVERERQRKLAEEKRQNALRRELAWLSRGARARATKPKFHVKVAQELIADVPELRNSLELKRMAVSRLGKQVISLEYASFVRQTNGNTKAGNNAKHGSGFNGDTHAPSTGKATNNDAQGAPKVIFDNLNFDIGPGDRIGIVGANGLGKTTLLDVFTGTLSLSSGKIKIGASVKFGYLTQDLRNLAPFKDERLRTVIGRFHARIMYDGREESPAKMLEKLGFSHADLNEFIGDLSGGQARIVSLLLILLEAPNVLVLDEPGNDLDIDMLACVESMLDSWPGTLILVTHDRYLMERVTDNQYALINKGLRHLPRGVAEYLDLVSEEQGKAEGKKQSNISTKRQAQGQGHAQDLHNQAQQQNSHDQGQSQGAQAQNSHPLSQKEIYETKKKIASTERKLQTVEAKLQSAYAELNTCDPTNYEELANIQARINEIECEKDALEETWLSLSEKL